MNKKTIVLSISKDHRNGVNLAQLLAEIPNIPRRTLQRWVQEFIKSEEILAEGQGPSRLYFPKKLPGPTDIFPDSIPLSADAREILKYINQAQVARKPASWHSTKN